MKTSELKGAALDWAVAKCEGFLCDYKYNGGLAPYSTNWAQGGEIIERERITLVAMPDGSWQAKGRDLYPHFHNPTPLIAAMRCYVASKLGDEVEIPKELK